jgi:hypothetical protein
MHRYYLFCAVACLGSSLPLLGIDLARRPDPIGLGGFITRPEKVRGVLPLKRRPLDQLKEFVLEHTTTDPLCPRSLAAWNPQIIQTDSINMGFFNVRARGTPAPITLENLFLSAMLLDLPTMETLGTRFIQAEHLIDDFDDDPDLLRRTLALGHLWGVWQIAGPDTYFPKHLPLSLHRTLVQRSTFLITGNVVPPLPAVDELSRLAAKHTTLMVRPGYEDWHLQETSENPMGRTVDLGVGVVGLKGAPAAALVRHLSEMVFGVGVAEMDFNYRSLLAVFRDPTRALQVLGLGHLVGIWSASLPDLSGGESFGKVALNNLLRDGHLSLVPK